MEDVLDLYHEEYDRERPVVCFDESSKQLLGDVRPPIEAAPGRMERYDTEYQRNGTRNLFMFCRTEGWVEARRGDRASHSRGLRSTDEVTGGPGIS